MENNKDTSFMERFKVYRRSSNIGEILSKFGVLFGFIILVIVSTILNPRFLTSTNILNVTRQISIFGILAIGQTFVILISGIDLSVGSILALVVVLIGGYLPDSERICHHSLV